MYKIMHISSAAKMLLVIISACLMVLLFSATAHAAIATWDGETDLNLSTAANWVGDVAPVAGDDLVFDTDAIDFIGADYSGTTINNDFAAGTSFNSISITGSSSAPRLDGNAFELVAGLTSSSNLIVDADITLTAPQAFTVAEFNGGTLNGAVDLGSNNLTLSNGYYTFNDVVSGSGLMIVDSAISLSFQAVNSFTSALNIPSGTIVSVGKPGALGAGSGHVFSEGSRVEFVAPAEGVYDYPSNFTIGGPGQGAETYQSAIALSSGFGGFGGGKGGSLFEPEEIDALGDVVFSGDITLSSNTSFYASPNPFYKSSVEFTSVEEGSFEIDQRADSGPEITVNGKKLAAPKTLKTTYADDQPDFQVFINPGNEALVTGVRSHVAVYDTALLKGTGTVEDIIVFSGGVLAPGTSPGCLNSSNLTLGGTFQAELAGTTVCTQYDQQRVVGTVDLTGGTLDVQLLSDFEPEEDDEFVIIANDAAEAVTGTFTGLAEGASVSVGDSDFTISYKGGTGNDVVLTASELATAPDTGFFLFESAQPLAFVFVGVSAVGALALNTRSTFYSSKR